MVRTAFWLLFAFAAAVVVALLLRGNQGNIAIFWPPYRIELSSNMALVIAIVGFFILHVVLLGIARVIGLPERLRAYREQRRVRRANKALQGASLAWFEGRYEKAERLAAQAATEPATTPAATLIAARSAHRLGAADRRDDWLRQATEADPAQSAAVLAEAEFALDDRHPARALAAVDRLRVGGVEPRLVLTTSIATWREFGRWDQVLDAVRAQKGRSARLTPAELDALRVEAYEGMLAPLQGDAAAILQCWRSLRSDERRRRELAVPTVVALMRADAPEEARKILTPILDREYDDTLVECYGAMTSIPARTRLEQLERWRTRYGDRPRLLEMLGRVCASEHLWGQAETYLLQSVAAGDSVSARVALAQLYDEIGRRADASTQFQAAARLALGDGHRLSLQLDPVRAQGRVATITGARPVAPNRADQSPMASLPAAAAAGALASDDDTELAGALPHPVPAPDDAIAPASARSTGSKPGSATPPSDDVIEVDVAAVAVAVPVEIPSGTTADGASGEGDESSAGSNAGSNAGANAGANATGPATGAAGPTESTTSIEPTASTEAATAPTPAPAPAADPSRPTDPVHPDAAAPSEPVLAPAADPADPVDRSTDAPPVADSPTADHRPPASIPPGSSVPERSARRSASDDSGTVERD